MSTLLAVLGFAALFAVAALIPLRGEGGNCGGNCGSCGAGSCDLFQDLGRGDTEGGSAAGATALPHDGPTHIRHDHTPHRGRSRNHV